MRPLDLSLRKDDNNKKKQLFSPQNITSHDVEVKALVCTRENTGPQPRHSHRDH